jgi:sporulation protein YlmC with PRC-barrel domain
MNEMARNPSGSNGNDSVRDPDLSGTRSNAGFGTTAGTGAANSMGERDAGKGSQAGGARIEGSAQYDNTSGPGPRLMTASTLEGDRVVNRAGEDLGEIEEIMLDVPAGRIAYAVMSSGGFLGMGDKLFAIPWSALTLDTDNKCFVLDVDRQRLQDAPGFDKDNWPNTPDHEFDTRLHSYYGARPYWE